MAKYRNYSDDDKAVAIAFADACNNVEMAARECKVPAATLRLWLNERDSPSSPSAESVAEKKGDLADKLEALAHSIVDKAPDKIDDAPLAASLTAAGIAIDKMRLLREQATSISQSLPQTVEEKQERVRELAAKHGLRMVVNE